MGFEKIIEAAKNQDVDQLKKATELYSIDVWKQGTCHFSAVSQLVLEKKFSAANFLITHGANINYVARGAAQGNQPAYAQELLDRGACLDYVARGAAQSGQKEFVEELLDRGADINFVAYSAIEGGHKAYAEELLRRGADINYVACGAAQSGQREYAENLLRRGAEIDDIAYGAALGGHKSYAQELLRRYANKWHVAFGANLGGYPAHAEEVLSDMAVGLAMTERGQFEYAEKLLSSGADIDFLVAIAALNGHSEYAQKLLSRGANIHIVATNAAQGGDRRYANELLNYGSNIKGIAYGAVKGGHISTHNAKNQMAYLSFFSPDVIPELIKEIRQVFPITLHANTQKRCISISKYMHEKNVSYALASTQTDPDCAGMLFLLMKLSIQKGWLLNMPIDVWAHIFSFATPVKLSRHELTHLGFIMARSYLTTQLSFYQSNMSAENKHKDRAASFHKAVTSTNNKQELQQLVIDQRQVLAGENPYLRKEQTEKYKKNTQNKTVDKFHSIIGFWSREITGAETHSEQNKIQHGCVMQ